MSENMVKIELELDNDLLFKLMLKAHERDLTLNQFINYILKDYINTYHPDEIS